jgi:ATP-binding cassette subfamily F protein 3
VVVNAIKVGKSYGQKVIFKDAEIEVERGQKIALVGKNGEGKSTFLKIVAGEIEYTGDLQLGHQVDIGYFAQNQAESLNPEKTVFDIIDDAAVGDIRKNIRGLLGSFLFSGDTIDKKVKVLSGGEKNRLALCKLLLHPYNLLVLDEPTNHLDMRSKEVLKNALLKYDGTLIVVSHDRDFLEGLTEKMYYFGNQSVKPFIGTIYEFLKYNKLNSLADLERKKVEAKASVVKTVELSKEDKHKNAELKKELDKEIKKLTKQIGMAEESIEEFEKRVNTISHELTLPEILADNEKVKQLYQHHSKVQHELDLIVSNWESMNVELEAKQKEFNKLN